MIAASFIMPANKGVQAVSQAKNATSAGQKAVTFVRAAGTEVGKDLVNGALSTGVGYGVTELTGNQELGMAAGVLSSFAFGAELDAIDESLNISGLSRPKNITIKTEAPTKDVQFYKSVIVDENSTAVVYKYGKEIKLKKVLTSNNEIYVSNDVNLKPKALHTIDSNVSKTLKLLNETDNPNIPKILIISSEEMQTTAVAAYNPITNILYIDEKMGNPKQIIKLQEQFACADNELSTTLHELIHWQDSENYKLKYGEITDFNQYKIYINEKCKTILYKFYAKGYDIYNISDYALKSLHDADFAETYTEYRVKEFLER